MTDYEYKYKYKKYKHKYQQLKNSQNENKLVLIHGTTIDKLYKILKNVHMSRYLFILQFLQLASSFY